MALSAKNQEIMFYMLCETIRNVTDDQAFAYFQSLQASDPFALSEIANFTARILPALQAQLASVQAQETPISSKITAIS